jgi:hypothetical protein
MRNCAVGRTGRLQFKQVKRTSDFADAALAAGGFCCPISGVSGRGNCNSSGALGAVVINEVDTCAKYASSDTSDGSEPP